MDMELRSGKVLPYIATIKVKDTLIETKDRSYSGTDGLCNHSEKFCCGKCITTKSEVRDCSGSMGFVSSSLLSSYDWIGRYFASEKPSPSEQVLSSPVGDK